MSLQLTHCAHVRFCYVRWMYKTSALGELREGEIVFGSASRKVGILLANPQSLVFTALNRGAE